MFIGLSLELIVHIRILLIFSLSLVFYGCDMGATKCNDELMETAKNKDIMDEIWGRLNVFYGTQYKKLDVYDKNFIFLNTVDNELSFSSSHSLFEKIEINWERLGYLMHGDSLKYIAFRYKEDFEEDIINGEEINSDMVSSAILGSINHQVEFVLIESDAGKNYSLTVTCDSRFEYEKIDL